MRADPEIVTLTHEDEALLAKAREKIDRSVAKLRDVVPCILDMSAREATLSSHYGHTLQDKIELFELARDFGLRDIGLSNFFDFPSVTDQFLDYLVDNGIGLDGFLVTIAVEPVIDGAPFPMGPAARRTAEYNIPNVILLVEIAPSVITGMGREREDALNDLRAHVEHYRGQLPPETERRGRIFVRIGDAFDAFDEDPEFVLTVFKLLGRTAHHRHPLRGRARHPLHLRIERAHQDDAPLQSRSRARFWFIPTPATAWRMRRRSRPCSPAPMASGRASRPRPPRAATARS